MARFKTSAGAQAEWDRRRRKETEEREQLVAIARAAKALLAELGDHERVSGGAAAAALREALERGPWLP